MPVLFSAATLCLTAATVFAVLGVLVPQRHLAFRADVLKQLAGSTSLTQPKEILEGRLH